MKGALRYELLCKIASGGAASVYVARAAGTTGLHALVALKRPHTHLLEVPGFRESFFAEARIASRIVHPNVVAVRDVAAEGDSVHLVMDYVEGSSLASARRGEPVPVAIALRLLLDACAGLHAAHEAKGESGAPLEVVHRDVSPQNLLVGIDGLCRITDFGIAKCLAENTAETTQGLVKGKVAYMAPEQVRGETVDRRVDVFALGVVAWELLTGQRLFRGKTDADSLMNVLDLAPEPPSGVEPAIPAALDAVVLRALAKERGSRHATAAELGADLEQSAHTTASAAATHADVARWLTARFDAELQKRRDELALADAAEPTADAATAAPATPAAPVAQTQRRGPRIGVAVGVGAALIVGAATLIAVSPRVHGGPTGGAPPVADTAPSSVNEERSPAMAALPPSSAREAIVPAVVATAAPKGAAKPARRLPRQPVAAHPTPISSDAARFKAPKNPYE